MYQRQILYKSAFCIMTWRTEFFFFIMNNQPIINSFLLVFHNRKRFIFWTRSVTGFTLNAIFFLERIREFISNLNLYQARDTLCIQEFGCFSRESPVFCNLIGCVSHKRRPGLRVLWTFQMSYCFPWASDLWQVMHLLTPTYLWSSAFFWVNWCW